MVLNVVLVSCTTELSRNQCPFSTDIVDNAHQLDLLMERPFTREKSRAQIVDPLFSVLFRDPEVVSVGPLEDFKGDDLPLDFLRFS